MLLIKFTKLQKTNLRKFRGLIWKFNPKDKIGKGLNSLKIKDNN